MEFMNIGFYQETPNTTHFTPDELTGGDDGFFMGTFGLLWMAVAETICAEDIEAMVCRALSRAL
jgi:hypothetical protein